MGKQSKRPNRRDRQRIEAFAREARSYRPVTVPDGVQCPDCSATSLNSETIHDDSCPLMNALDDVTDADGTWFRDHPGEDTYIRPVTRAEILTLPDRPFMDTWTFTHAVVTQIVPGLRRRRLVDMNVEGVDPKDLWMLDPKTGDMFPLLER